MSKELIKADENGVKTKIKEIIIIILIIIIGALIAFMAFYFHYTKKDTTILEKNNLAVSQNVIENEENQKSKISKNEVVDDESKLNENKVENEQKLNVTSKNDNENLIEDNRIKDNNKTKKSKMDVRLPEWTDTAVADIKSIYGSDDKQVYLTFDDGPSPNITPKILDILKEEEVPATFFVVGKCIDEYPELVKREYEEGHFLANHGYSHTYSQIYASVDNVYNEYLKTNESIKNAIGNPDYDSHLFRFPGGSSGGPYDSLKAQAKKYLQDNQIASTNWNCLTSDAAGNYSVQSQYNGALETQGAKTSLIILMHDAADKQYTPDTLKLLIKHYKEEGYEFKNFYEIFNNENSVETVEE